MPCRRYRKFATLSATSARRGCSSRSSQAADSLGFGRPRLRVSAWCFSRRGERPDRSEPLDGGGTGPRAVVLVEGSSDQCAVEALAERQGRNLDAEGISDRPDRRRAGDRPLPGSLRPAGARHPSRGSVRRRRGGRFQARPRARRHRREPHARRHGRARLLRVRRRPRGRADPRSRRAACGRGRRGARRPRSVPDAPEAARVAGTAGRGSAATVHGQRRQPQDPLRAVARRGARSERVPRPLDQVLAHV